MASLLSSPGLSAWGMMGNSRSVHQLLFSWDFPPSKARTPSLDPSRSPGGELSFPLPASSIEGVGLPSPTNSTLTAALGLSTLNDSRLFDSKFTAIEATGNLPGRRIAKECADQVRSVFRRAVQTDSPAEQVASFSRRDRTQYSSEFNVVRTRNQNLLSLLLSRFNDLSRSPPLGLLSRPGPFLAPTSPRVTSMSLHELSRVARQHLRSIPRRPHVHAVTITCMQRVPCVISA